MSASSPQMATSNGRRIHGVALVSVLVALLLTLLLEALDQTVVGTALPRIIADLHGFDRYTWVVIAYTLASTVMVPVVGKLSDLFGRKGFVVVGVVLFLIGSVLSGASQTIDQLIAFRALQGLGAGIGIALAFTVIADIFPPAERAKFGAMFGAVYGVSNAVGPTLGGWLTDHGPLLGSFVTDATRWRWVFYINLPIGIIALAALVLYLPANISDRSTEHRGWAAVRRIDVMGSLLAAAATVLLLLGLTWGGDQTYAWNSVQVVGSLVGAAVLYVLFVVVERFVATEPILPLDLFRNGLFSAATVLSLLQIMILVGLVIYLPLYLQGVLGESATYSGALITPLTLSSVVGATVGGVIMNKLKRYQFITIIGSIVMTIGVFFLTRMTPSTSLFDAAVSMVTVGLGIGVFFSVLTLAAQNALPRNQLGAGTAAVRYVGQLGAVLGVAIIGTVVNHTISVDVAGRVPPAAVSRLTPSGFKAATNPQVLVSATNREQIRSQAEGYARQGAMRAVARQVPPGPQHDRIVASAAPRAGTQAAAGARRLVDQVFSALKASLADAITRGFIVALVLSIAMIVGTFFLKDVPLAQSFEAQGEWDAQEASDAVPSMS